jgi:hypothetical protein
MNNFLGPRRAGGAPRDGAGAEGAAEYDIRNLKVLWTACAFFHRFYVFHSFESHNRFVSLFRELPTALL